MKVILSRKGFDSAYGGFPSLILPDGSLISFPIPHFGDRITYAQLRTKLGKSFLEIMKFLKEHINIPNFGKVLLDRNIECHLDPDLEQFVYPRHVGWKPIFGQIGQAQRHLENQSIGKGDLFLFFGWFKETEWVGDRLRYKPNSPDLHIIYGYLQVDKIVKTINSSDVPIWMKYHPHVANPNRVSNKTNAIYVARSNTSWNSNLSGGGVLSFNEDLILTEKKKSRSIWKLPDFFKKLRITYHSPKSWNSDGTFRSARIGQEFVIEENKKVEEWATQLISRSLA
ncbi:MAG: hypothetical protein D6732_09205 [Methanobacteriota archaeon]|nr:MAG: hypothetical protein D6732_09205 [Euryarchaeota archaeon]